MVRVSKTYKFSKATFENLVKHLLDIEEGKNQLLNEYFPEPNEERRDFEKLFDDYVIKVDNLVRNASISEEEHDVFPFVTIGSRVEVEDAESNEPYKFRIVTPYESTIENGDISYLSPMGKSLLLKKAGEKTEVNAPGGTYCYKIKAIKHPQ
ncbi:MAG TPA: GreA/GreB family elongation factor [Syntrophomonadaceae bacterium]|nr:GreA/GreB family elongation factor [Syntrophomonadaceae bacterium]